MSIRNEIRKLYYELKIKEKEYSNIRKKHLEEKDPNKKEKLYNQGTKIRNIFFTKKNKYKALEKLFQAFNTPANTPVKSKKKKGNNNVQPIKKKSRKK